MMLFFDVGFDYAIADKLPSGLVLRIVELLISSTSVTAVSSFHQALHLFRRGVIQNADHMVKEILTRIESDPDLRNVHDDMDQMVADFCDFLGQPVPEKPSQKEEKGKRTPAKRSRSIDDEDEEVNEKEPKKRRRSDKKKD